jgi:acid phosphatase
MLETGRSAIVPKLMRSRGRSSRWARAAVALAAGFVVLVPAGTPDVSHAATSSPIVIVMLENKEDIKLKASNALYLTSLKSQGRYFSQYYGVVHPSFPNYLAISGGSTFGSSGGSISAGMFAGTSLWDQLSSAGLSWGVYEELVPSPCYPKYSRVVTSPTKDKYGIGHNPGIVYANVYTSPTKCQQVLPLTSMPSALPAVSFVTPSYCNDMHGFLDTTYPPDCQRATDALITRGDTWLRDHVEAWRAAGAIVIITFDEGTTSAGTGGHIYTVEVGPGITPSVNPTTFNHYSTLAGVEQYLGLTKLRNAQTATPLPIG